MLQEEVNNVQDANNDLLLADDDAPVKYRFGDVFANLKKEDAQAHLEKEEQKLNDEIGQLKVRSIIMITLQS